MSEDKCRDLCTEISKVLPCPEPRAYLVGDVVVLACDKESIIRTFRAIGEPPYVPMSKVEKTWKRRPAITVRDCTVLVVDIPDFDQALKLTATLAKRLVGYMPFKISHVDLTITYRSSEDGGLFTRYQVQVHIVKNYCDELKDQIKQEVEKIIEELSSEEGN